MLSQIIFGCIISDLGVAALKSYRYARNFAESPTPFPSHRDCAYLTLICLIRFLKIYKIHNGDASLVKTGWHCFVEGVPSQLRVHALCFCRQRRA
jgi:hypothetical protein